ncbi:hypothetical protein [Salinivibrio costicola]|uniref:hypothetical protein n=1 Tax=Salinivibrio costicola TaxID=51367 RepID=UPI0004701A05|nr:hypothetical protein [Salinivibrio costicola]
MEKKQVKKYISLLQVFYQSKITSSANLPTLLDMSPPYDPQKKVPPATKAIDKPPVTGMAAKAIPIRIPAPTFTAPETTLFTKLRLQVSSNQPLLLYPINLKMHG